MNARYNPIPIAGRRNLKDTLLKQDQQTYMTHNADILEVLKYYEPNFDPLLDPISEIILNPDCNVSFDEISFVVQQNGPLEISAKITIQAADKATVITKQTKSSPIKIYQKIIDKERYAKC